MSCRMWRSSTRTGELSREDWMTWRVIRIRRPDGRKAPYRALIVTRLNAAVRNRGGGYANGSPRIRAALS